jgi:hypothetical protein
MRRVTDSFDEAGPDVREARTIAFRLLAAAEQRRPGADTSTYFDMVGESIWWVGIDASRAVALVDALAFVGSTIAGSAADALDVSRSEILARVEETLDSMVADEG